MKYTFQYETIEQRESLITEHKTKTIIEERNISEGNFIVFSDNPEEDTKQVVYVNVPREEFENSKEKLTQQELKITDLKKIQNVTSTTVSEISTTLQELIELSLETGNV